jgi:two-component system chemotaxis response regulator CheY
MKCLVVEESGTIRRILWNALHGLGCEEIVEAADGKQALERCDAEVGLVVTGRNLPGLDGLELVKRLRQAAETAQVRILLVSARNTREDVMEAAQAGVNGYLLKPFTLDVLRQKLEELLQAGGAEEAKAA